MDITFINVGYGDSILIRSAEHRVLIDGGTANPAEFSGSRTESYAWLCSQGIERLDAVIISHIHDDHVCGLEKIIDRFDVKELWLPYPPDIFLDGREAHTLKNAPNNLILFTRAFNCIRRIVRTAQEKGMAIRELDAANCSRLMIGRLRIDVLGPEAGRKTEFIDLLRKAYNTASDEEAVPLLISLDRLSNDASLLLRISDDDGSALFPGDSCPPAWQYLLPSGALRADLWKLPHHGQIDSVTEQAVRGISPSVIVTTSSSDRRYNSSNPAVYSTIRNTLSDTNPTFLFSDEYSYPPYFSGKEGSRAVRILLSDGYAVVSFE